MSKEKQIEEMAKVTMKHCKTDNQCGSCHWSTCNECLAEILYNAGYRKPSEVAREIFEEIDDTVDNLRGAFLRQRISELKKKYIGKEND